MILEEETFKEFGYHPKELTKGSHKKVINKCDECGKIRLSEFKSAYKICKSCGKKGERNVNYKKERSREHSLKLSKSLKEGYRNGNLIPWNKGLNKRNNETLRRISDERFGSNNPSWKGGVNSLQNSIRSSEEMKNWKLEVYKIDNYTCVMCEDNTGGNLNAHHIRPLSKLIDDFKIKSFRDALNCNKIWDASNGLTLCKNCHILLHRINKHPELNWREYVKNINVMLSYLLQLLRFRFNLG